MTFQFRIQLQNVKQPPVWRAVQVPARFSFWKFHLVIQAAFGWYNCHMFEFSPEGFGSTPTIGLPDPDLDMMEEVEDSVKVKLKEIFSIEGQKFTYIYDFGDLWVHTLVLEKVVQEKIAKAVLLAGKGACPPEDCGGPRGYEELKKIMKNPKHLEYGEWRQWLGLKKNETWNARAFDLVSAQREVRKI